MGTSSHTPVGSGLGGGQQGPGLLPVLWPAQHQAQCLPGFELCQPLRTRWARSVWPSFRRSAAKMEGQEAELTGGRALGCPLLCGEGCSV